MTKQELMKKICLLVGNGDSMGELQYKADAPNTYRFLDALNECIIQGNIIARRTADGYRYYLGKGTK